jgi:hypothetical protein
VSVRDIEDATGLRFLTKLDPKVRAQLVGRVDDVKLPALDTYYHPWWDEEEPAVAVAHH